ncbi:MAG: hypothetical protein EOO90_26040 [Pedobacter sp.]|nr:MAG: hypothetical protein EOO90_26040 [Pedobacter sp.]
MKFQASEKYRKYLVHLNSSSISGYVIWGTDMTDEEKDKLFLRHEKILVLRNLTNIRDELLLNTTFSDTDNFNKWVESNDVFKIYSKNDFTNMSDFSESSLNDRSIGKDLINSINLIRDFALQVDDRKLNQCLDSEKMHFFFDYLYDEFFWKKRNEVDNKINTQDIQTIAIELREIWGLFSRKFLII